MNGIFEMGIWESSFVFTHQSALLWVLDTMKVGVALHRNTWGCCLHTGWVAVQHHKKIPFESHNRAILHLSCPNMFINTQQLNAGSRFKWESENLLYNSGSIQRVLRKPKVNHKWFGMVYVRGRCWLLPSFHCGEPKHFLKYVPYLTKDMSL